MFKFTLIWRETADRVCADGQDVITHLSSFLVFVSNIYVARHVDIDGVSRDSGHVPNNELYTQTVEKARLLVRTLEATMQSLYDDGSELLLTTESIRHWEAGQSRQDRHTSYDYLDALMSSLKSNLDVVQQTLEALLSVGHDQADMAQGDYTGSIEWRMSRLSVIDNQFGGSARPMSAFFRKHEVDNEELIDMETAFRRPGSKPLDAVDPFPEAVQMYQSVSQSSMPMTNGSIESHSGSDDEPPPTWPKDPDRMNPVVEPDTSESVRGPLLEPETSPLFDGGRKHIHNYHQFRCWLTCSVTSLILQ